MQPTLKFDRTLVTVLVDEVVHVMLELAAPPATPLVRPPLDVVVVLDRSGSMSGAPLESVTAAAAQLLRLAGAGDRIGVVAFDDKARLVLPLAHHEPDSARARLRTIQPGGSTNLSGGWLKALELLTAHPRQGALRRIVVLTDGHANVGLTDVAELAPMVEGGAEQGVTTSCIGFDDGYDEQLLAALADAGAGNDYWCDGPDQAATVFTTEFGGLASVVAQNVSVEVTPSSAVAATEVLNEFPITEVPNGLQVALGDAYGGEHRKVVAKFHLRPTSVEGSLDVATLTIRWASTSGDIALHTVTMPVKVTVGDGSVPDADADDGVTEEVTRLQVARHRKEARAAAERGDFSTASALLADGAELLACMPGEAAVAAELRTDARSLREGMWTARDAKRQYSRSRSATRGRRSDFEHLQEPPEEGPA